MGNKQHDFEIGYLEGRLRSALQPVPPRAEFVTNLHSRLLNHVDDDLEIWEPSDPVSPWVLLGIVSGLVMVLGFLIFRHWQGKKILQQGSVV